MQDRVIPGQMALEKRLPEMGPEMSLYSPKAIFPGIISTLSVIIEKITWTFQLVLGVRDAFCTGKTRSIKWRIKQLKLFVKMIDENTDDIYAALESDLRRVRNITLHCIGMKSTVRYTRPGKFRNRRSFE